MSGHTDYTIWITNDAKYLNVDGKKEKIITTFFTSDPMPNSDTFNIKTNKGVYELGNKEVDWDELRERRK
jgi:hypothetical protein